VTFAASRPLARVVDHRLNGRSRSTNVENSQGNVILSQKTRQGR